MIRKATLKDVDGIVKIFREEYSKEPYNENWDLLTATKRITNYFKDHELYVLEIEEVVQGVIILTWYVWHTGKRGFIHEVVVSSDYQGKGHGKRLMEFAEKYFEDRGMKEINLMSSKKSKAYEIYKSMGYEEENGFVSMFKEVKK